MKSKTLLITSLAAVALTVSAQLPSSSFRPQCANSRMMWASINNQKNASLGDYQQHTGKVLISWRMLPTDSWDTSFYLYSRPANNVNAMLARLTSKPVVNATCYQLSTVPTAERVYYLIPGSYFTGTAPATISNDADKLALRQAALDSLTLDERIYKDKLPYISIPLKSTEDVCTIKNVYYGANDASVGDLDGDGQMEIVVKRLQMVTDDAGNVLSDGSGASYSVKECLYAVIWDAYKLDGTFLWRVKGGPGVILGNSSAFAVADFDGDGCAEMAIRTCEGTVFGDGEAIPDTDGDGKIDYRTWGNQNSSSPGWVDHYNSAGPEFLSIVDGKTGRELARDNFINRETSEAWGDGYWKRACSFRVGVGCFDETGLPSVVIGRGVYARSVLEAWDYRDGQLSKRWRFDTRQSGKGKDGNPNSAYAGQGNHSFNTADLDGDGLDEVMYGSMAVDDDGQGLWTTKLGHGDANHVGKFLPDREGLQVYHCLESGKTMVALHDARDGKVIWKKDAASDNDMGRCMVADIDPAHPGCEFWYYQGDLFDQNGNPTGTNMKGNDVSCAAGIWFDGSLSRQGINEKGVIHSFANGRTFTMYRYNMSMNNSTKGNPCWYGDLLGDWREEIILPDQTKRADIKIFSTWYPSNYKFPFLMSDHTYMMQCLNQNIGYNQPNNLGYFLGTGMDMSKVPLYPADTPDAIKTIASQEQHSPACHLYDLSGRVVTAPVKPGIYVRDGRKLVIK